MKQISKISRDETKNVTELRMTAANTNVEGEYSTPVDTVSLKIQRFVRDGHLQQLQYTGNIS